MRQGRFARIVGAWAAPALAVIAMAGLTMADARPARAGWTEYGISGAPMCPPAGRQTGGCPTLQASCESAAYQYWGSNWPGKVISVRMLDYRSANCEILRVGSWPIGPYGSSIVPTNSTCSSGTQLAWADTGCVPRGTGPKQPCGDCDADANNDVSAAVGNPIEAGYGRKFEHVADFTTGGPNTLRFVRYYDSEFTDYSPSSTVNKYALGFVWHSNFHSPKVFLLPGTSAVYAVERANGQLMLFQLVSNVWTTDRDLPVKLTGSASTGWTFTDWNDQVTTYTGAGRLASIRERNGYQQDLAYDANGRLATVTDSYGRQLSFAYNSAGRVTAMTVPGGRAYRYAYDSAYVAGDPYYGDRLIKVTYPDDTPADDTDNPFVRYLYGIPGYRYMLTGIIDEKGNQFATFGYRSDGLANSSEHAGGTDQATVTYLANSQRTVTNALGQQFTYTTPYMAYGPFSGYSGMAKLTRIDRTANATVPAASEIWTYDGNGYIASHTDFNGHQTTWVRNTQGLETSRTEAAGTPQARTITTTWHASLRVPTQVVAPGKTSAFTYDSNGRVLTRTETDTTTNTVPYSTNGQTRTWTYSWDASGLLLSVDGPRTDVNDTTGYGWTGGLLSSVTNALGQVTQITAHDPHGLPQTIVDPNGAVTDLTYDARGRLTGVIRRAASGDATTGFTYDAAGLLTRMTLPDGAYLDYSYDTAHRPTAVANNLGERIEYTLDLMGNRTAETIKTAAGGTITKTMTRAYDQLGRLLRSIGAANQTTTYAYDHNGNVVSLTDPLNGLTTQAYDALDRLIGSTDPLLGLADYDYDSRDDLTAVTDPRAVQTSYVYDGFGRVIQTASPDAGTTVFYYDPAGNLTQATDGRGVVTNYTYDALNRVTAKSFPAAPAENVTYGYDDPTPGKFGIGRLATISDESGSTSFTYDARGNVTGGTRVIGGVSYTTSYAYDLADRLTQIVYPSGRIVDYGRDSLGRVVSVTTRANATATPVTVASAIAYQPFGPLAGASLGNGLAATLSYDLDYRLTSLVSGDADTSVQNLTYGYDAADNILSITDAIAAGRSQTFQYDALFRLTQATGAYGTVTYGYDAVGNRTSLVQGATSETYATDAFSNRLSSVTVGASTRSFTYDGAGNTATDSAGDLGFTYNKANRFAQLSLGGTPLTDYRYNALGQRVVKQDAGLPATATQFHYDQDGKLIAESGATGTVIREYLWIDGLPLATVEAGALRYIHADHLGSPQKLTDASQAIAWDGQFEPFGEELLIAGAAAMPLRFPGQYADDETALSYNYFRDYDPSLGRYIQSDPIGLLGGLATYLYVAANPFGTVDRFGLQGHHVVPFAVFDCGCLPPDTQKVFESATSGSIPGGHGWSKEHAHYSQAVREMWDDWLQQTSIDPRKMTPDQAREFIKTVASSKDPRISPFLRKIEKSIGRKVFSRFVKCGIVIFFVIDASNYGLDYATETAIDDALWPLNDPEIGYGIGGAQ